MTKFSSVRKAASICHKPQHGKKDRWNRLSLAGVGLFGVRDGRCYGGALMPVSMVNSFTLGAITPFLLLGAAAHVVRVGFEAASRG